MTEHDYEKFPELTNKQIQEFGFESPFPQITDDFRATVIKVTDGDTITLRTEFRDFDFPLRFLNIDAPEMNAGGEEAKEWLKEMIEGTEVDIKINPDNRVGKYGRLLGKVISMGLDMGEAEIRLGLSKPFGYKLEGQIPPVDKVFSLKQWL